MMTLKGFNCTRLLKMLSSLAVICTFTIGSLNAATITSAQSGNWSDTNTWVGGTVPGPSDSAVIVSGNVVTVDGNDTVNHVTVSSDFLETTRLHVDIGNTLTVLGTVHLESTDMDATANVILRGTMYVNGDIILDSDDDPLWADFNMRYENAHLYLGGNFVFSSFGAIRVRDGYPSTLTFNGSGAQTIPVGSNISYYNVEIENTSSAGVTLEGVLDNSNLYGNFTITEGTLDNDGNTITGRTDSTFTIDDGGEYLMYDGAGYPAGYDLILNSGSTINYVGTTQVINHPPNDQTLHHLTVGGTNTKTLGDTLALTGDLTVNSGVLDADNSKSYSINVAGDVTVAEGATLLNRNNTFTLEGSAEQTVDLSGTGSFYNLVVNNTHDNGVTINGNAEVSNILTLTDGVVTTSDTVKVTNASYTAVTGYSSASFINGHLQRDIDSNHDTYAFPVGNGTGAGSYYLAEIMNDSLETTSNLTANFGPLQNHNDGDMVAEDYYLDYNSINTTGTWKIEPDVQPTGGSYHARMHIDNFSGLIDNQFGILKRDVTSTSGADWTDAGGWLNEIDQDGRKVSDGYSVRWELSSFSEFGVGSGSSVLPIVLLDFDALFEVNNTVVTIWKTATEINNDFFTIERSSDGVNFTAVGTIDGAGNSSTELTYRFIDQNPLQGTSYYRLKQTDFNGQYEYSNIVAVTNTQNNLANMEIMVSPNPASAGNNISINHKHSGDEDLQLRIFEAASGKAVHSQLLTGDQSTVNLPTNLAGGMYLMHVQSNTETTVEKLIIR